MGLETALKYQAGRDAAKAQGDIAGAQLSQQQSDRSQAVKLAEATPQELQQLQQGIDLNKQDIQRKQKLLDSSDPALIEAGQQALKLLRGEDAKTLGPVKAQIAQQEQQRAKLQAQLGSGYENTTAGIQALQAFNQQSTNALASAQQGSLGQLLGVAQDSSARYGTQQNIQNSGTLASLFGNIQNRGISAINGTQITNAGAGFVGDLQNARNNNQLYQNIGSNVQQGIGLASGTPGGLTALFSGSGGGSSGGSGFTGTSAGQAYMGSENVA
jgi:hypothetical protein